MTGTARIRNIANIAKRPARTTLSSRMGSQQASAPAGGCGRGGLADYGAAVEVRQVSPGGNEDIDFSVDLTDR
jgi:hypothetical protein